MGSRKEIWDALIAAGIGEPVRSDLMAHSAITAELVQRLTGEAKRSGKGAGAIVLNIRAALEASGLKQSDSDRRRILREQERRASRDGARQDDESCAKNQARLDALDDDEFGRLAVIARKGLCVPVTKAIDYYGYAPRKSKLLGAAVLRVLDSRPKVEKVGLL